MRHNRGDVDMTSMMTNTVCDEYVCSYLAPIIRHEPTARKVETFEAFAANWQDQYKPVQITTVLFTSKVQKIRSSIKE